jgi:hypothetical protein
VAARGPAPAGNDIPYRSVPLALNREEPTEAEQLSALVGGAYDAALDPELWPSVLEQLYLFARGTTANHFSQDVVNHHASRIFNWGGEPYP